MLKVYMYKGDLFHPVDDDNFLDFKAKNIGEAAELIELALKSGYSVYIEKIEK